MRDPKDTEWADQWISNAFELFFADLREKHGDVSYSFAYTLWNQTISRLANKGWQAEIARIYDLPKPVNK